MHNYYFKKWVDNFPAVVYMTATHPSPPSHSICQTPLWLDVEASTQGGGFLEAKLRLKK